MFLFCVGILLALIVLLLFRRKPRRVRPWDGRAEKGAFLRKSAPSPSGGPYPLPGNHENDILPVLLSGDPYFQRDRFLADAFSLFCGVQKAMTEGNFSPVRPVLQDELYDRLKREREEFRKAGLLPAAGSIRTERAYLHLYERDGRKESLTVFLTVSMCRYLLDPQSLETVDGDADSPERIYYFLTFQRKCGVMTRIGPEPVCPRCGTVLRLTDRGDCAGCGAHLTNGEIGWVLGDGRRLHNFSDVDERGVVTYPS